MTPKMDRESHKAAERMAKWIEAIVNQHAGEGMLRDHPVNMAWEAREKYLAARYNKHLKDILK